MPILKKTTMIVIAILSWVVSLLLIVTGIVVMTAFNFFAGFALALSGLFFSPPVRRVVGNGPGRLNQAGVAAASLAVALITVSGIVYLVYIEPVDKYIEILTRPEINMTEPNEAVLEQLKKQMDENE